MPELLVSHDGPIARVAISHPERRNAITYDMMLALPRVLDELGNDANTRVIVLTGATPEAFAAGGDISEFKALRESREDDDRYMAVTNRALLAPATCAKPVIASIRGFCMGGGLQLAVSCDLRFVADDAVFRMPAARLGVGYAAVGIERFIAVIGLANTTDLFISARQFGADEALRIGFADRVIAAADLEAEVDAYCKAVANNAPLTVAAARAAMREAIADPARRDAAALKRTIDACWGSHDYHEGRNAFLEKRKPRFLGC
ncbi:MAG: enoyl-CoA hydratase [Alphaproteobacteria bacterium]|nr:enoyl-CoA hydratase [Alphaproteobacteria bacterium]